MSIFSFSNLIAPEKPVVPTNRQDSLRDLVKKMMDEKQVANSPVAPAQVVEVKPQVVEAKEVVEPKKSEPEKEKIVYTEEKLAENQTYGTLFLKRYLSEFSDLLQAGKELQTLEEGRKKRGEDSVESKKAYNEQMEAKKSVQKQLTALLNNEVNSPKELQTAIESYETYLNSVENSYQAIFQKENKEANEFLIRINKKKQEISSLIKEVGSSEIFSEIKGVVTFCKSQREKIMEQNKDINPKLQKTISQEVSEFVEGDLHGAVMLAQEGDLIGIMMRAFAGPKGLDILPNTKN
jgi:hypothetical protein